jgi:hypothetical protein
LVALKCLIKVADELKIKNHKPSEAFLTAHWWHHKKQPQKKNPGRLAPGVFLTALIFG